jgi:SynChlorMet cassette protein ScmC
MNGKAFSLRLADGNGWLIVATPETTSWVEKFACIMQLRVSGRDAHKNWPRMFFCQCDSGQNSLQEFMNFMDSRGKKTLPRSGWRDTNFPSVKFWQHTEVSHILCEIGSDVNHELDIIRMWTCLYMICLRTQSFGGLPAHAALVELDGKGVLLAGPGGSGKSTLCSRLPKSWSAWSDDQALIVRAQQESYMVHPIPTWSVHLWQRTEMTWNVEKHVPLTAIFFIEPAAFDQVVPMGQGQAAAYLAESAIQVYNPSLNRLDPREARAVKIKLFENASDLVRAIPAYKLRVSLKDRFGEVIEKVLSQIGG